MSSNEYMNTYMKNRYRERMAEAKKHLGGKCVKCGATEDLDFDHIDSKTKTFTIGCAWSVSSERFWEEIKKCQLLCKKCHKIKTNEYWDRPQNKPRHGTFWFYKKYKCRCGPCTKAYTKTCKKYKETYEKKKHGSVA